jgi:hypothetical protein
MMYADSGIRREANTHVAISRHTSTRACTSARSTIHHNRAANYNSYSSPGASADTITNTAHITHIELRIADDYSATYS